MRFATPIFVAQLEEAFETGRIEVPAGAPSFQEARAAYAQVQLDRTGPRLGRSA
jgi:capsid protein